MKLAFFTRQLTDNADRIDALVSGVSQEEARWKPDPNSWSILEVINHLHDEEVEDFRVRLDIILQDPEKPWPPIDPEAWVDQRRYNEQDLEESLIFFLDERDASLAWLHDDLVNVDWQTTYQAPWGEMRAGDMLVSWVTHDQLHMRQLVELHRLLTVDQAGSYRLDYAGPW
jgi:hypothetical protein